MLNIYKFMFLLVLISFAVNIQAQKRTEAELNQAALIAFSGNDLSKKNGPLVKAGFDLALLVEEYKNHAVTQSLTPFQSSNQLLPVRGDKVLVDIVAVDDPQTLVADLENAGMQINGIAGPIISGLIPINSIESIAGLQNVRFFHPSMYSTNVGLTTSQGDVAMRSDIVKSSLGYDGTGITVGVISDSYDYLVGASTDVTSGDLPGVGNPNGHTDPVNVLDDDGTTDEGRAMLQIVHDVAPGALLAFATANGGEATFANNIDLLRTTAGADIIVDDIIYYAEPMFQDGVIAQAVDDAFNAGVPYFSSAGNQAQQSYESVWRSGPVFVDGEIPVLVSGHFYGGTAFDFDPGAGVDYLQSFTLANGTTNIVLQWDSPFASVCTGCPGSPNDLDIYLLDAAGTSAYFGSYSGNINGDAVEVFQITNSGFPFSANLMIVKYGGADPGFLKYVNLGRVMGSVEYATNSSTIYGHANATGAEAVAAAAFYETPEFGVTPPLLEDFSSYGPTAIRFTTTGEPTSDPRSDKPEITAPDGVNTTFFGSDIAEDVDTYKNFFGTSAAAPHAAAVAALMLSANGSLTPSQIYANLEASAIDMGTPGFDNGSGYGLIQADITDPFPVELVSFNAVSKGSTVDLQWATATEVGNYGFEIERKANDEESKSWEKIGFVSGSGNSNSPKDYSYTDRNFKEGSKATYRLKQIDNAGTFKYSNAIEIEVVPDKYELFQNYPNPFNPVTNIKFSLPEAARVKIDIFNIIGEKVKTLIDQNMETGFHAVTFNAENLTSGTYIYRLQTDKFTQIKKMLLLK